MDEQCAAALKSLDEPPNEGMYAVNSGVKGIIDEFVDADVGVGKF